MSHATLALSLLNLRSEIFNFSAHQGEIKTSEPIPLFSQLEHQVHSISHTCVNGKHLIRDWWRRESLTIFWLHFISRLELCILPWCLGSQEMAVFLVSSNSFYYFVLYWILCQSAEMSCSSTSDIFNIQWICVPNWSLFLHFRGTIGSQLNMAYLVPILFIPLSSIILLLTFAPQCPWKFLANVFSPT